MGIIQETELIARNKKIAKLHVEDLLSMTQISKKLGVSRQRIEQIIKREYPRLKFREIQKKRTAKRNEYVLSRSNKTNKELAIELQVTPGCIGTFRWGTKYNHRYSDTVEERFWKYVEKTKSCWLWTSCMGGERGTQPRFQKNRKSYTAHIFAWELLRGKIPEGMFLIRKCENYRCVNPNHMKVSNHYSKKTLRQLKEKTNAELIQSNSHQANEEGIDRGSKDSQ